MAELRSGRDRSDADLVELRLDGVEDIDVAGALAGRRKPVIVTCRAAWEGGVFKGSEAERLTILAQAIAGGADYVDVEWRADRSALASTAATQVVLSHHVFDEVPGDLAERVRAMRTESAGGVIKVAVAARSLADCVTLQGLAAADRGRHVVIGLGEAGLVTRVCSWLFGSEWTYAGTAAPGQLPVSDLDEIYRARRTNAQTQIYALIGSPLSHSASPAMQNAALAQSRLDAVYVPMPTTSADDFLRAAEAFGVAGASITAPLKTSWNAGVEIDDGARTVGAINTLKRNGRGVWEGRNFDVEGFLAPLASRGLQMTGQRTVVLGAGGAARAVICALKRQGAVIEVASRRADAAEQLARETGVAATSWPPRPGWDLLVNATPVGTAPEVRESPLESQFVRGAFVYDLVYNPRETRLMQLAKSNGARVIGGLEMLVGQARAQFEYWTGRVAADGVMEAAAQKFLDGRVAS